MILLRISAANMAIINEMSAFFPFTLQDVQNALYIRTQTQAIKTKDTMPITKSGATSENAI